MRKGALLKEAVAKALAAGATDEMIVDEAKFQAKAVGTTPFNHMIRALNIMAGNNDMNDWVRLAGALVAQRDARKAARTAKVA